MKEFQIYLRDLIPEKQAELQAFCNGNAEDFAPLATFEFEDAAITPENYDGHMSAVTLFYRDGANYKYTETVLIPTDKLEAAKLKLGKAFYDQDDAQIQYDYDLGISRELFHDIMGTAYNDSFDHNYVIIQQIDGIVVIERFSGGR